MGVATDLGAGEEQTREWLLDAGIMKRRYRTYPDYVKRLAIKLYDKHKSFTRVSMLLVQRGHMVPRSTVYAWCRDQMPPEKSILFAYDQETKERAVEMYMDSIDVPYIANEIGCSEGCVYEWIKTFTGRGAQQHLQEGREELS